MLLLDVMDGRDIGTTALSNADLKFLKLLPDDFDRCTLEKVFLSYSRTFQFRCVTVSSSSNYYAIFDQKNEIRGSKRIACIIFG